MTDGKIIISLIFLVLLGFICEKPNTKKQYRECIESCLNLGIKCEC
jgi:hypothetical protein